MPGILVLILGWHVLVFFHVASLSSRIAPQRATMKITTAFLGLVSEIVHDFRRILFVKSSHRASLDSRTKKIDSCLVGGAANSEMCLQDWRDYHGHL